jgi:predicted alpha/beta superfamily hydrolase
MVTGTKLHFDIFSGGAIPAAFLVGIGYADQDIEARRFRDFTPTNGSLPPELGRVPTFGTGGATRFLDCLRRDVIPELEGAYPLDPDERLLIGVSLAALFVAHTFLSAPESFARFVAVSPSLWWDDGSIFRAEADRAAQHKDLAARVALIAGADEETPGGGWENNLPDEIMLRLRQLTRLRELHGRLAARNYPSLKAKLRVLPEGKHISMVPNAIALGLVDAFGL